MRVLLIEDERHLARAISELLERENITVDWRSTVYDGLDAVSTGVYDCFVVDVRLPDGNGIELIEEAREMGCVTPILVLTVQNNTDDRVRGLNAGADDYLGKPFDNEELLARVKALVRRSAPTKSSDEIHIGNAVLHRKSRTLSMKEKTAELSSKEFLLLEYLVRNQGQVLTRDQLLAHVWGPDAEVADNALDTYIYFLRKKCDSVGLKSAIQTVRGQGYRLN
ncbi:response regulator transcription factor [Alicyclobacillus sp. SO9]|uniref:response regulator transcription factor n=1 Tax=Alicyclobacillus sp. SO9 TaxID=2665646 RepID=UPI0018E8DEB7|nr:response regulator transcription factor [Alicyclobacillus sp. SO9]QQE78016.1 response regulator transcription factor [Alicyclobacillus sp. SO9]